MARIIINKNLSEQEQLNIALVLAVENRLDIVAKDLLKRGADPNWGNFDYEKPILCTPDLKMFKLLVEHGAILNTKDFYGETLVQTLLKNESREVLEYVVKEKGLKIDDDDLSRIFMRPRAEFIWFLVEELGVKFSENSDYGLLACFENESLACVRLLCENGVKVTKQTIEMMKTYDEYGDVNDPSEDQIEILKYLKERLEK